MKNNYYDIAVNEWVNKQSESNGEFKNADISECNLISEDFIERLNSNLDTLEEVL